MISYKEGGGDGGCYYMNRKNPPKSQKKISYKKQTKGKKMHKETKNYWEGVNRFKRFSTDERKTLITALRIYKKEILKENNTLQDFEYNNIRKLENQIERLNKAIINENFKLIEKMNPEIIFYNENNVL